MPIASKSRLLLLVGLALLAGVLAACNLPALPPTPEPAAPAEEPVVAGGEVVTMVVGPELVDCVGVAPQECLQVKTDPLAEYTLFYSTIEGFQFEPGYEYELLVEVTEVENPPADASRYRYRLVEVVAKNPVAVAQESAPLEGTLWVLEAMTDGEGNLIGMPAEVQVDATFQDGQVAGSSGCNRYFGSYAVDGNSLSLSQLGGTMMACPEPQMQIEQTFLANLQNVATFSISGGEMQVSDADGQLILVFEASQPEPVAEEVAAPEGTPLEGTLWVLEALTDSEGNLVSPPPDVEATATFQDGQIAGNNGCNRYFGSYTVDGDSLTVTQLGSTMMACPEPQMQLEQVFMANLQNAATFSISGGEMQVSDADGQLILVFEARQPTPLTGTTWQALSYNNGQQAVVSLVIGTEITALFGEDGTLSGSAGCNNYTTSYQVDGDQITIGMAASTMMACAEPEGIMEQEAAYLAALSTANTYRIEGDQLELRTADGALVASYEAAEAEAAPEAPEAEAPAVDPAVIEALANLEYQSAFTASGTAPLSNGIYEEPAAPGTESPLKTVVTFVPQYTAVGEIDGQLAAAVILATNSGGSGVFVDLALVLEEDGQWVNVATTLLGDRVDINSVTIENNQIVVDMITQGPDDPMCCPTQQVVQVYELQDGQLAMVSSEVIGTVETEAPAVEETAAAEETPAAVEEAAQPEEEVDITGVTWKWTEFTDPVNGLQEIPNPERYTMELRPSGLVVLGVDCNRGSGSYTIDGSAISMDVATLTRIACPEGSLGDQFVQNLNFAAIFFVQDGDLFIDLFADGGTMRFTK